MAKTVNKAYNDGVCVICREKNGPSAFSARVGATAKSDLKTICKMAFSESSIRMEDSEYANQVGFRLDRKIAVRKPGRIRIDTECSVVIGRMLYHVSNTDYSKTEIYLSLTEVRMLEV